MPEGYAELRPMSDWYDFILGIFDWKKIDEGEWSLNEWTMNLASGGGQSVASSRGKCWTRAKHFAKCVSWNITFKTANAWWHFDHEIKSNIYNNYMKPWL